MPRWLHSGQEADFTLVTKCEYAYLVARNHESIERNITGLAIGNDQFANLASDAPADERVPDQVIDCTLNRDDDGERRRRILLLQEFKHALEICKRAL